MKKLTKKQRSLFILCSCLVLVIVAGAAIAYFIFADRTNALEGSYARQSLPDYKQFLPENAIKNMFDDKGGFAYLAGSNIYYVNGEYKTTSDTPCIKESVTTGEGENTTTTTTLYINVPEHGKKTPEELAAALNCEYIVYDNKLVIFSYKENFVDTFNDVYTLEAFILYLKGADEADIKNAFVTLPNFITNGANNSVYYTDSNLNLGVQTQIYSLQMEGFDTGYEQVADGPMIIAGQGENKNNNTIVRVFNTKQTCVAQFLAFPSSVKGGVDVKAGKLPGTDDILIATAAYDSSIRAARSIKVFDTFGTLCYSLIPEGIEAPYAIEVGNFTGKSGEMCLFVTSRNFNPGKTKCALYNLKDGSFIKTIKGGFNKNLSTQKIVVSSFASSTALDKAELAMSFSVSGDVYYLNCEKNGTWTKAEYILSQNATAIYDSAFDGQLLAATTGDTTSEIIIYGSPDSGINGASMLNVGHKENMFYSTYAEESDTSYVDYAKFNHMRTDYDNAAIYNIRYLNDEKLANIDEYWDSLKYKDWTFKLTSDRVAMFHAHSNMWEPCFTHRWSKITSLTSLISITDTETGYPAYVSIGRDNLSGEYVELNSSFYVATYADAIPEMAKMRIYPLRTMLQQLVTEFRGTEGNPENLVAVSPVHEHEIDVAGSIGDYHPNMIKGFAEYLLSLYGSVENINKHFGTSFADEADIDAPRYDPEGENLQECRGDWDIYGKSDYFTQWSLYTRYIINKRIMEAYREALIAGFPPESINAHQIPEGDAVGGFLGEAHTRLSPTDVVSICGTAYGGTRYGIIYNNPNNFLALSYASGHYNTTLGEYSSLSGSWIDAYEQLVYFRNNGVKFTHVLVPYDSSSAQYKNVSNAEKAAIGMLQDENEPRTVSTGGTGAMHPVYRGDKSYNIVQLGDSDKNGLLKSINIDGTWEGSVYLTPFRSKIDVIPVKMDRDGKTYTSDKIKGLQYGDQVELTFMASYKGSDNANVRIEIYHAGYIIEDATCVYTLAKDITPYRYVLSNQLSMEDIEIRVTFDCDSSSGLDVTNMECSMQIESVAHKYFGDLTAEANAGGVSFDVVD